MSTPIMKTLLNELITLHHYSISTIAKNAGINNKAVRRIQHGMGISLINETKLIDFYCACMLEKNNKKKSLNTSVC